MSLQTEAIKDHCERNGHVADAGGKFCLNCGVAVVPAVTSDNMGDGKPLTKPSNLINPKDAIGQGKLPMHLVPTAVPRYAALAFAEGALKYGKYNWRVAGVRMSIYLDAIHRHLSRLQDGEWADGDSLGLDEQGNFQGTQVPHLASIIACCGIILDAWECDKLTDDRPPVNLTGIDDMDARQAHIARLKAMFADYDPHQHVITDVKK